MADRTMTGDLGAVLGLSAAAEPVLPPRYQFRATLGVGGFGEVVRAWDTELARTVAIKLLRADVADQPHARARFLAEARVLAGLQHPGVVPVHDRGVLPDGRPWISMDEIRGRTLDDVLDDSFDATGEEVWRPRVEWVRAVARTLAFAHDQGVVHCDVKPSNVMLGALGDVKLVDWGIAASPGTRQAAGTRRWLPPECRADEPPAVDPSRDVWSLGALLGLVLGPSGPPALRELADRCLAATPTARPTARDVAHGLSEWLDGADRRARARAQVDAADALAPEVARLVARATTLRTEAEALLAEVPPHAPEEERRAAWALQDRALALEEDRARLEARWQQHLAAALQEVPGFVAAHQRLADHHRARHDAAHRARDRAAAARHEALLRVHDRGAHTAFLRGDGAVTLATDPPGAAVRHYRFEERGRRMVPVRQPDPPPTPLRAWRVAAGSHLLVLSHPARADLRLPIRVERGGHWRPPGPVALPTADEVRDDCVVAEGPFDYGGDPEAADGAPGMRPVLPRFAIRRFPVTNREWLAFLDDLVDQGRTDDALAHAPWDTDQGDVERLLYARGADGRFTLAPDRDGRRWEPDWPVAMVTWHAARAYAAWRAARDGLPWRLPFDVEWAKAARGVDGRIWPWGFHAEACWARMVNSQAGPPGRVAVDTYPVDESVYGVRGLGGNSRDWCLDAYRREGPVLDARGRPALVPADPASDDFRLIRGGSWASAAHLCRSTVRFAGRPSLRNSVVGVRLARSLAT